MDASPKRRNGNNKQRRGPVDTGRVRAERERREAMDIAFVTSAVRQGFSKPLPAIARDCAPSPSVAHNPSAPVLTVRDRFPLYRHPYAGCKVLNLNLVAGTNSWSGLLYNVLNSIASGAGDGQRTGDVIRVIGYEMRGVFHIGTAATPTADCECRLGIVWSPIPALPITCFFEEVGGAYSGVSAPDWDWSHVNEWMYDRFMVLDTYRPSAVVEHKTRCDHVCNYDENTATVASGQLYVVTISGENPGAANTSPTFVGTIQVYYQDV